MTALPRPAIVSSARWRHALSLGALIVLAACGGGGGSSDVTSTTPTPGTGTPSAAWATALGTGDASAVDSASALDATLSMLRSQLAAEANTRATVFGNGAVSGVTWNPSHDSATFTALDQGRNHTVLVGNWRYKGTDPATGRVLAMAGKDPATGRALCGLWWQPAGRARQRRDGHGDEEHAGLAHRPQQPERAQGGHGPPAQHGDLLVPARRAHPRLAHKPAAVGQHQRRGPARRRWTTAATAARWTPACRARTCWSWVGRKRPTAAAPPTADRR